MTKRLQLILQDADYRDVERAARARDMSVAEWVRRALAVASRQVSSVDVAQKLEAIRAAARYSYPITDIDTMLAEVESGYLNKRR
jgi:hypothetical protein